MSVDLSPELESLIDQQVRAGRYHSSSQLIEKAVRDLLQSEQIDFFELRRQVADSGVKLLSDEEVAAEVRSIRGSRD